ncbi:hypothetical protein SBV1_2090018 [Verrucomicrobia bacterium]|nr:hypothetical protein SBV1_2090018 [Verrucomicrobiota bacterium]
MAEKYVRNAAYCLAHRINLGKPQATGDRAAQASSTQVTRIAGARTR